MPLFPLQPHKIRFTMETPMSTPTAPGRVPNRRHILMLVTGRGQMTGSTRTMLEVAAALSSNYILTVLVEPNSPMGGVFQSRGYTVSTISFDSPPPTSRLLPPPIQALFQRPNLETVPSPPDADEVLWVRNLLNVLRVTGRAQTREAAVVWDVGFEPTQSRVFTPLNRFIARRVSLTLTQGPSVTRQLFGDRPRSDKPQVKSVIPALSRSHFDTLVDTYNAPSDPDDPLILCVGSIHPRKRQMTVVKALSILRNHIPDVRIIFAGEPVHQSYARKVHALSKKLGVSDLLTWTEWATNTSPLYGGATLLIHAARREGLPHVVREAMLAGVPVLARTSGAIPDVIDHGHTGVLLDRASPRSLANEAVELIQNKVKHEHIRTSAHNAALTLFDPERWQREYLTQLGYGLKR